MKNIIYLSILVISLITACSSSSSEHTDQDATEQSAQATHILSPKPDYPAPEKAGAFIRGDSEYFDISAGDPKFLYPTNAPRSFGFSTPVGNAFTTATGTIAILNAGLDLDFLQLTEFRAVATPVQDWSAPIDDSNVAWIPASFIPASVKIFDADSQYAEIIPEKPLTPGFYVLHDDSFLVGKNRTDVSVYYPFIVTAEKKALPWTHDANRCFKNIFDKYGSKPATRTPPADEISSIQKCALAQRIAWKIATKSDLQQTALDRILYLNRLATPYDPNIRLKMHNAMDPSGDQMANVFYQIRSGDDLVHIAELYDQSEKNQPLNKELVKDFLRQHGMDDSSGSFTELSWWPFQMLSSEDKYLNKLFDDMIAGKWQTTLIAVVGAIKLKQATERATEQSWVEQIAEQLPASIVELAWQIKIRDSKDKIILGPYRFLNVPSEEIPDLKFAISSKKQSIESCIDGNAIRRNVVLILEQPLNGTGTELNPNTTGVLKDPLAQENTLPVITPDAVHCILKSFSDIPGAPSLDNNRSFKMGITIMKN